jgi:hypothetical protein
LWASFICCHEDTLDIELLYHSSQGSVLLQCHTNGQRFTHHLIEYLEAFSSLQITYRLRTEAS